MIISTRPQSPVSWTGQTTRPTPQATTLKSSPAPVSFGFRNALEPTRIFKMITEQYFWTIMTMDVLALWIPRIWTSFRRGRIPYDPRQDPEMRDKPPLKQWGYSLYKNFLGLNHKNAVEETLREVEMGPGQSAAYAVVTIAGASLFMGRLGHLMRHDDLEMYNTALKRTANNASFKSILAHANGAKAPEIQQKLLERYATEMLMEGKGHFAGENALKAANSINLNPHINLSESDDVLKTFLKDMVKGQGKPVSDTAKVTYQEAMTHWIDRWSHLNQKRWFDQGFNKQTDELASVFNRLTHWFNEKELKLKSAHALDHINVDFGGGAVESKTSGSVGGCLRKMKSYVQDVYKLADDAVSKLGTHSWAEKMPLALSEGADKVIRKTMGKKLVLCFTGMIASGLISLYISSMAQRGKSYPANRTFDLKNAPGILPANSTQRNPRDGNFHPHAKPTEAFSAQGGNA